MCATGIRVDIQISGTELCSEIKAYKKGQVIFDKGNKTIQWRKYNLFNKLYWEKYISTCNRIKLNLYFTSYGKINSKWLTD